MIEQKTIDHYFKNEPRHIFFEPSVKIAEQIQAHTGEKYPRKIIDLARPNEREKFKKYREEVHEPVTKKDYNKILTTLKKIQKSEGWGVNYDKENFEDPIQELLREYMEINYPGFGALETWFFNYGMDQMLNDPNAIALVYPLNFEELSNNQTSQEREVQPFIEIVPAKNVYWADKNLLICKATLGEVTIGGENQMAQEIPHFIFADRDSLMVLKLIDKEKELYETYELQNNLQEVPFVKLGGRIKKLKGSSVLWESLVQPCVPSWNEALRRYSDHQVNMVNHLHPERWQFTSEPCPSCRGTGRNPEKKKPSQSDYNPVCPQCKGSRVINLATPFANILVKPVHGKPGEADQVPPTPPAGYITKPIEGIDFLIKEYLRTKVEALEAINLDYLADVPLNQSGKAKEIDREEINTFMFDVSSHVCDAVLTPLYRLHSGWRLGFLSPEERAKYLPIVPVPRRFDVINVELLRDRAQFLQEHNFNPFIVAASMLEYYAKEYGEDSLDFKVFSVSVAVDPLFGQSNADKIDLKTNDGCSDIDYRVSSKIYDYIRKAFEEDENFFEKARPVQRETIYKLAEDEMKAEEDKAQEGGAQVRVMLDDKGQPIAI